MNILTLSKTAVFTATMLILNGTAVAENNHHKNMHHGQRPMQMMQHMEHGSHEHASEIKSLRQVEASKVCMVNNTVFNQDQNAIEIEGKTYYGCCPMCEELLNEDASIRRAIDPVSGASVDKASAVIGADTSGKVYYFENEKNLHKHMAH